MWSSNDTDYERFMALSGKLDWIDTPLEFALLSYYSQPVLNIRPPEANVMLPANNPRFADQKLGAALFQEMQILRFLGETAAVSRHETVLQWIIDRGNVTRAEVEVFYRNGIRGLVSQVVDEEFRGKSISNDFIVYTKQRITSFFVTPNQNTLNNLKEFYDDLKEKEEINRDMREWHFISTINRVIAVSNGWDDLEAEARLGIESAQKALDQSNAHWGDLDDSLLLRIISILNIDLSNRLRSN